VWATHDFPDVPETSPHHDDISWLVDQGITSGFGDGTFKPKNPVARQQMATFLRRYNARFHVVSKNEIAAGGGSSWTMTVPCPDGERALAGGVQHNRSFAYLSDSYPDGNGWFIRIQMEDAAAIAGADVTGWAICGPAL